MAADRLRILFAAGVTAALVAGLAGCGQKGPLYLPDKGGDVVTRPGGQQAPQPSTQPQPNRTENEENKDPPR